MVMRMNKKEFINELIEKTDKNEQECIIINDIIESYIIIGRNNKEKIKKDFIEKLNIAEDEANKLYNICAEIIVKGVFNKKA